VGAGGGAGVAAQAAVHLAAPEGEPLVQSHGIEQGQFRRGIGCAVHLDGLTKQGVGQHRRRRGAAVAFALGVVGHAEAVILAVGGDGHTGLVIGHAVDLGVAAQILIDAGHVERAFAGQGKDGHILAADQVFLKQLDNGAGIAALDHNAHLFALERGKVHGGIVDVKGAPHQLVHILGGLHEQGHGVRGVIALLPAEHAVQLGQLGLDGFFQVGKGGVLPCAKGAQGGQRHVGDFEQRFGIFQLGRGAELVDAVGKDRDHLLPALAFGG